eukprot:649230-Rhodomonas_salina.1
MLRCALCYHATMYPMTSRYAMRYHCRSDGGGGCADKAQNKYRIQTKGLGFRMYLGSRVVD